MIFTESILADVYLLGIIFLILGHTFMLYRKKRWFALDPLNAFWAGVFIVYINQASSFGEIFRRWHPSGVFEETLFWIMFGVLWIIIGYELRMGVRIGKRIPDFANQVAPAKFMLSGWLLIGIGLLGYWYLVNSAGSFQAWISVSRGGTDWENVSAYFANLSALLPAGVIILLFNIYLHPSSSLKKILVWVIAVTMLIWFFYLGTRSRTIMMTISIFAAYYLPRRKNPSLLLVCFVFLCLIIVTNFQQHYRGYFTNLSFNFHQIDMVEAYKKTVPEFMGGSSELREQSVSGGAEFNCVMSVVSLVPGQVDYNYGYGFLELFTRPIPRAFWPDKIYPLMESYQGVLRKANLSGTEVPGRNLLMGPAFTYIGHWYYVGGVLALCFGGIVTGVLLRAIRSYYDYNHGSHGVTVMYALLLPIGFGEAAATPFAWVYSLPLIIIPFWIVLKICQNDIKISRRVPKF